MENHDNTAAAEGGEEFKIRSIIPSVDDDKGDAAEESEDTATSDSVDRPGEAPHTAQSNESTGEEFENTSVPSVTSVTDESAEESETPEDTGPAPPSVSTDDKKSLPQLTLVLIGDTSSIEIGPRNILLGHEEQANAFSSKLYDLCGRHIGVVNMLSQQNTDHIPLNQGTRAFVLLLPNGLHSSHYNKGVQWLEETFGREALAYLMTIVTHQSGEKCESALEDLKANAGFVEERYSTCTRSMMDEREIVDVLEKIDVMVSESDPRCYSGLMWGDLKEEKGDLQHKSHEEERMDCEFQQNATGETEETDEGKDVSSESSGNMCAPSIMEDTSPTSQTVSADTEERDELEESAAKTELKSDPGNEHSQSEKSDDSTAAGRQLKPQAPSPTNEKGTLDEGLRQNKEKQSLEISEEINRKKQHQREMETLFIRLDLQETLSPADFLQIGPPVKQHHVTSEKDLAHTFLHRLMMLDYRARYIPVKQDNPEVTPLKLGLGSSEPAETDDSDLEAFLSFGVDTDQSKQTHVHPMDVQMAVFHHSDTLLKQIMITKLSQCQYALPLLVPDPVSAEIECPLWTFRQIRKSWKVTETQDNSHIVTMNMPICNAETHMVSFFRLGSLSVSKSQLMNTLINERHSTFFHRNCPGSTKSRHLMDGVAEIAWYCPAGKPNDAFNDCIAFCNLHGDALSFQQQRDILIEKSSVNVVLLPALRKDDKSWTLISALLKSEKPLICLTVDDTCGVFETKKGKYKMGLKDRSQSDTSEQLKKIIAQVLSSLDLSSSKPTFRLETMAEVPDIRVDEREAACQEGKSAAMKMVNLLEKMDVSEIKAELLPCQGHLWHQWCKVNKELYHLKGHIEKERSKKQQQLMQIREEQCAASCSELMKSFIESLASLPPADKVYFLKWTQILIDALSTHDLSSILQSYDKKWSEVLALKNKHDKSALLSRKQTELELISSKLQSATFGLEHIFREMGQIYEAHRSQEKKPQSRQTDWSKYPELAAELMISGHPMELMDGDAGHVPLKWISSVLKEVIKKLGDKRVFVLSVLGIQSSGKSTMLNAMFGLQFAVSAGRCTKGAFMQLVRVSEEIKEDFKFDYVLVVDTEGLRALELAGNASLHHDNELATFVVGLGNLTLINIFGENPAEMQDVLQIVVQAFMRMKKVKLSPSCVFVHQNVTDIAAAEKNMDGKRRLQEKLDQMAQLAAKEEVCNAECFSDVIEFDVQRDVKYAAQLWEGSPPMAPPNPGYSESIQELKKIILTKASQTDGISLSGFNSKIQDLWNALLKENFVFSFKNTLEIAAYRKLEVQYGNWTWALRNQMLIIENQLHNRIENGNLDRVELNYLLREMSKKYEDIKKTMAAYFEDDRDKDMLVQWRGRFESKIKEFRDEQAGEVKRKLDEVIHQKNARKKLDDRKTDFENKLLQKSKDLAHQLKDKAKDEEQLQEQFNSVWSGWVTELTTDTKPVEDINFEEEQLNVLQELGIDWVLINEARESGRYKYLTESGDYSDYVILPKNQEFGETTEQDLQDDEEENKNKSKEGKSFLKSVFSTVKYFLGKSSTVKQKHCKSRNTLTYDERQDIIWLIDEAKKESLSSIKSKPVALRGYRSTYLREVAKKVKEKVETFQSEWMYVLRKDFTVDLLLYVFDKAESWLLQSQREFKMNNDALAYLESKKMHYYNIFQSFCKGNSSAVVLGELICEMLKTSIVEAAVNKAAIGLAGEMKCNFPAFSGNRLDLEKHMLKSLAQKEDFKGFMKYIRNPRSQAEAFIKAEVNKYIFRDHKGKALNILKKNVDDIHRLVSQALFHTTKKVQGGNTNMWLREFFSSLKDELKFATICSENFSDINNFDFLVEEINKGLQSTVEQMMSLSLENLKDSRQKPHEILIEQLCSCCWVRCPFCSAVCTNTIKGHSPEDHSVPFHRPSGINGWHYRNTVQLCIYFCTTNVASNRNFYPRYDSETSFPYKQYRKGGPEYACWRITPDESKLAYWKWFVCRFQKELEEYHNLEFQGLGEIPPDWKIISKREAIKSLDEMCE